MAGYDAALLQKFANRAQDNEVSTLAFILSLAGIGLLFSIIHGIRESSHWWRRSKPGSKLLPAFILTIHRNIRRLSLRRFAGVPSLGHANIILIYVALNLIGLFGNLDNKNMALITNIASRTGWLAVANLLFVVFFALKNTPLAFLTVWSYERLNCLHRIAGYTAVAHVLIHAGTYTKYFISEGRAYMLVRTSDIWGIVAGSCWIGLALAAVFLRRRWYELFYYIHVTLWAVSCVALAIHQPQIANKVAIGTIVAGSMWALDRIIRLVRITYRSVNNSATLTPLPNGGTRVTLAKTAPSVVSGKHCFLWIPGIRLFETHPFTIASANPLEFVIASHNGFTGDLHKYALAHAGVPLMASTDGPYGTVPNPSSFETIVLVAGGSGASYTFGLAQQLLGQMSNYTTKRVVFVWVVKDNPYLQWFENHFKSLTNDPRFSLQIFVTRSNRAVMLNASHDASFSEKKNAVETSQLFIDGSGAEAAHPSSSGAWIDLEKSRPSSSDDDSIFPEVSERPAHFYGIPIQYGRPDVPALIRDAVSQTSSHERVLVSGCGPDKLMNQMRDTTVDCILADGPSIELHCEQFGW
ncbi:Ferric reductase, NAD binding protein [Moelleriella libera RCEF 2490]|uniref:Ferric reductase, NAD binding protein n=1 Tax=Moelleriella libera RCEF 2490 TaxID=1081109 RepID=A0A167YBV1_9HYPO|nr:Ferric reductase, NAD binding protein [Moelleriella libera RCEF 2490]